jgi:dTDP-4-dehydrorhamnose reductase
MNGLRIAVIGRSGQLAKALSRASRAAGVNCICAGRPDLDLSSVDSVARFLVAAGPSVVVNAAAYTAVDKAEGEPEEAFRVNAAAPAMLATLASHFGLPLIHVSTDYVFPGVSDHPYREDDLIAPLNVYGASKAAGEIAVCHTHPEHIIVRTSWVYSPEGENFVRTMLRLGRENDVVRVVGDQKGCPTSADDLAGAIIRLCEYTSDRGSFASWGTYHLAGSGETTWHDFAAEIFRLAAVKGWRVPRLEKIATADYPTAAMRPRCTVLDTSKARTVLGIELPSWQDGLARCIEDLSMREPGGAPV